LEKIKYIITYLEIGWNRENITSEVVELGKMETSDPSFKPRSEEKLSKDRKVEFWQQ
jgi:hypothetical protein